MGEIATSDFVNKKYYSVLQSLTVVPEDTSHDIVIYGQCYVIPKSGLSPVIEGDRPYQYDFGKKEVVLLSLENKEVYRKQVNPDIFVKCEYKWLKIAREEASIVLGLDNIY